jgi:hypothetical protein
MCEETAGLLNLILYFTTHSLFEIVHARQNNSTFNFDLSWRFDAKYILHAEG